MKTKFLISSFQFSAAADLPVARQRSMNVCILLTVFSGNICRTDTPIRQYADTPIHHYSATSILPYTNTAFSCIMHVHTRMSSGMYHLPELTEIAKTQGVDVIFLSDNLAQSIEFGLPPLRHIFWAGRQEKPSFLTLGVKRCLAEVQRENERQENVLYIPGVEVVPRFLWSGSLLKNNLVCHNHQRNLILLGTYDERFLASLPTTCGYQPRRHTIWIVITRLLLVLFIGGSLGLLFLPQRLARRSGYTAGMIRRAFLFALILPLGLLMTALNFIASLVPAFKIYGPDDPERFEQRVLDALKREKLMSFWAHPEAADHQEFKYFGIPFAVDTRPYPEVLLKTKGYTGFAGVNEGENKFVDPGSIWDTTLKQYIDGKRDEPPWCFGEMLYHYEGQAGKKLSNVETIVWAPEKKAEALLDSVRKGYFYARSNYRGQVLFLDQWQVNGTESGQTALNRSTDLSAEALGAKAEGGSASGGEPLNHADISLRVSARIPGEKAEVLIIRNGQVIKKAEMTVPFELNFRDKPPARIASHPPATLARPPAAICAAFRAGSDCGLGSDAGAPTTPPTIFYRAVVSGKYPVRLVTNPVFIR